jgi:hypothetical protein
VIPSFNLDAPIKSKNVDEPTSSRMIFFEKNGFLQDTVSFSARQSLMTIIKTTSMDFNASTLFLDESIALVFSLLIWTVARACTSFNCSFDIHHSIYEDQHHIQLPCLFTDVEY